MWADVSLDIKERFTAFLHVGEDWNDRTVVLSRAARDTSNCALFDTWQVAAP